MVGKEGSWEASGVYRSRVWVGNERVRRGRRRGVLRHRRLLLRSYLETGVTRGWPWAVRVCWMFMEAAERRGRKLHAKRQAERPAPASRSHARSGFTCSSRAGPFNSGMDGHHTSNHLCACGTDIREEWRAYGMLLLNCVDRARALADVGDPEGHLPEGDSRPPRDCGASLSTLPRP